LGIVITDGTYRRTPRSATATVPTHEFDIAIIGGGPAGLTAALYAGRNRERAVLLEGKAPGGQLLNTELIEDYPGFLSILGGELATVMEEQACSLRDATGPHRGQGRQVLPTEEARRDL